jgi:hypothetical protein
VVSRILVLLNAGKEDPTRVRSALGFASVASSLPDVEKVALIFFGDAVELLTDPDYVETAQKFIARGILTLACQAHAEQKQIKDELSAGPVTLKYVGEDIVRLVNEGYQVITF